MFEIMLERIIREEVKSLLAFSGMAAPTPATPAPTGGLFLSPKESTLLDYLENAGPRRQADIIAAYEDKMNATSIKETLSNLVHRRLVTKGPDGYAPAT
jgi:hypothetical protein